MLKIIGLRATFWVAIGFTLSLAWARFFPVLTTSYMMSEHARLGELKYDWVSLKELPNFIPASVVAAEDSGFCTHNGVEWGVLKGLLAGGAKRGGSTISQQMVKNLYLWPGKSNISKYARKAVEVPLTLIVETALPKRRIVEIYLNIIEYDTGVFGIEAAALHHFNVPAKDLTPNQMALLAAVLPNPKIYQASPAGAYVKKRAGQIRAGVGDVLSSDLGACVIKN